MTRLLAHEHVRCSASLALGYAERYFEELGGNRGGFHLRLRVPTGDLGIPGGVVLEKDVVADVATTGDDVHGSRHVTIEWATEGGGFPRFSGTLTAIPEEGVLESVLVLDGTYDPPGGYAGQLFDGAFGFWIARATARELLRQLRDRAETGYQTAFPSLGSPVTVAAQNGGDDDEESD